MWGPILSGFTILGVFLTLSAWINGRSIKKYIGELIKEESRASRELMDEGLRRMDEGFKLIARLTVEENEKIRREILNALK